MYLLLFTLNSLLHAAVRNGTTRSLFYMHVFDKKNDGRPLKIHL